MLQRLPTALAQVKANNASEIRQTIYALNWEKEITKKVCNVTMNSIKL